MTSTYSNRNIGQKIVAVLCTILFSSVAVFGTVAPAEATAATVSTEIAARP